MCEGTTSRSAARVNAARLLVGWMMLAGSAALTPLNAQNADEQPLPTWLADHNWVPADRLFENKQLVSWEHWRVSTPDSPEDPLDRAFAHPKARPPLHQNDVGMLQLRIYTTY